MQKERRGIKLKWSWDGMLSGDILYDKLYIMLNPAWYRTIEKKKKKKSRSPWCCLKQISNSSGLQWTHCGQGWLSSWDAVQSYELKHRTNWQSKLMCNWAVVHFTEPVVSSAGEITRKRLSHITMADFRHAVFRTHYLSPCECEKRNLLLLGAPAFWRPLMTCIWWWRRKTYIFLQLYCS